MVLMPSRASLVRTHVAGGIRAMLIVLVMRRDLAVALNAVWAKYESRRETVWSAKSACTKPLEPTRDMRTGIPARPSCTLVEPTGVAEEQGFDL